MSLNFSTGVRQGMANTTGLKEMFAKGAVYMYSGPQPLTADAAVQGTLLCIVTASGVTFVPGGGANGLNFDAPVLGVLSKAAAETWTGTASAAGTIGWGRLVANAVDSFGSSTSLQRIDFSIATTGADMNLPSTTVIVGSPVTVDVFEITLPM